MTTLSLLHYVVICLVLKVLKIDEKQFTEVCNLRIREMVNLSYSATDVAWNPVDGCLYWACLSVCLSVSFFQLYCCMKLSQWSACYWLLSPPVYAEHEELSLYDVWSWDIAVNYLRCSFKITLFIFSSALWYILLGECKWHCWGEKPFSLIWMC